ncbi:MAG: LVIVD repeat-containing protein, partial [Thermoleophilia bacterium]
MGRKRVRFTLAATVPVMLILALCFTGGSTLMLPDSAAAQYVYTPPGQFPQISSVWSPTHPDTTAWSQNGDPSFNWARTFNAAGGYDTPEYAYDVAVNGDFAYLADGAGGLRIFNVANAKSVEPVSQYPTPGSANGIAIAGTHAYVVDGNGLIILDISDPVSPSPVSATDTPGTSQDVFVSGDFAYIADGGNGMLIFNITDPANPSFVGLLGIGSGDAHAVAVQGNQAFLVDGARLLAVSVNDPSTPSILGSIPVPGARDIAIAGGHAYITNGASLIIIDVADPAAPAITSEYQMKSPWLIPRWPGGSSYDPYVKGIAVSGDYAYVSYARYYFADWGPDDNVYGTFLEQVDISDPANPVFTGSSNDNRGTANSGYNAEGVMVSRQYAFIADGYYGLVRKDISPTQFSYVLDQSPATVPDTVPDSADQSVTFSGLASGEYYFHVVATDGTDASTAKHVRVRIDTGCAARPELRIGNVSTYWANYADYVARELSIDYVLSNAGTSSAFGASISRVTTTNGVVGCNNSSCDSPLSWISSYDTPGFSWDIEVSGDYAYIADGFSRGLLIVDVSNPYEPV